MPFGGPLEWFEFSAKISSDMLDGDIIQESSFNDNNVGEGIHDSVATIPQKKENCFFYERPLQNTPRLAAGMNACLSWGFIRGSGAAPLSA